MMVAYREAVDQVFSLALSTPREWQRCFLKVLLHASQLYLGYISVMKHQDELEAISVEIGELGPVRLDVSRERKLRESLSERLRLAGCWNAFRPENAFSNDTGLHTLQDYVSRFVLHLPEIYEETFRVEACTQSFLNNRNNAALAQLFIGIKHLGRNHLSFVLQPLEWAADEGSWDESLD